MWRNAQGLPDRLAPSIDSSSLVSRTSRFSRCVVLVIGPCACILAFQLCPYARVLLDLLVLLRRLSPHDPCGLQPPSFLLIGHPEQRECASTETSQHANSIRSAQVHWPRECPCDPMLGSSKDPGAGPTSSGVNNSKKLLMQGMDESHWQELERSSVGWWPVVPRHVSNSKHE